ncbi:putative pentatricopeptide repeat-containing protein At3g47840 [Mercurialis annua]|uniref:putative pentatricopeptide repeat-containing protein At3g47840 n=1 Tax=Mercurialis annua TaxID=3986 RepID=UPI002160F457|nr:putative pentatricopeptide repeat-containing protein At3g47840 [Mercurialis annua]
MKLLSFLTTRTTLTPKHYLTISSSTNTLLSLDSYCAPNPQESVYSNNRIINGLIKTRQLGHAHKLFDEMLIRDVVTYNLLISGHGKHGVPTQALCLYSEMISLGIRESPSTFSSVLCICGNNSGFFGEGVQVHCRVVKLGFGFNLYIGSSLVGLYMHMGLVDLSLRLFDELPERNVELWNLVLRGFCELGRFDELVGFYYDMKEDNLELNGLTFCYLIRGCCDKRFFNEGRQLHSHVIKIGWVDSNVFVANALVDFYSACGVLRDAEISFQGIPLEDVLSWNSMLSAYADNGLLFYAVELFYMMQYWGKKPSIRSFVGFLKLCSLDGDIIFGKQIHCCVLKLGFDNGSVHVQSALISMYGKCFDIKNSVSVYENLPKRTLECCNSLMTSLLHCGIVDDVVEMFGLMVDEGIGLDEVTFSTVLKALSEACLISLASCRLVHCCAIKLGFESNISVSCSLMDTYSRSGNVEISLQVFKQLSSPNVFCFTAIISGFARNGYGRECFEILKTMIQKGLKPDKVTFLCVLNGCSHSGLVDEGKLVFNSMMSGHSISPEREHISCMVDLLGRAGILEEAEDLLQQTPERGDSVMWSSLLRSCRIHRNEMVGRRAAKVLLEIDPENFAVYLQVSNFYSEIGEYESSVQVREIALARKMTKEIGRSFIDIRSCH